jgi:hypothetical protein
MNFWRIPRSSRNNLLEGNLEPNIACFEHLVRKFSVEVDSSVEQIVDRPRRS